MAKNAAIKITLRDGLVGVPGGAIRRVSANGYWAQRSDDRGAEKFFNSLESAIAYATSAN